MQETVVHPAQPQPAAALPNLGAGGPVGPAGPAYLPPAAAGPGPSRNRWLSLVLMAAVGAGVAAWTLRPSPVSHAPVTLTAAAVSGEGSLDGLDAAPPLLDAAASARPARPVSELERLLYLEGSLRHSQPDGDWGADAHGQLQPSLALRRRFDQMLTTLGEISLVELTSLVRSQATADLGEPGAKQVMAVWERYLDLLRHRYSHQLDGQHLQGWEAALAERQQVRRSALGLPWAEAFFGAEETALRAHLQQLGTPGGTAQVTGAAEEPAGVLPALARAPAPGTDASQLLQQRTQAFGLEAAQRLAAEDEAQERWQARLADARQELSRLQAAPELSAPQREQAQRSWLDQQFSGSERVRARAVLGH